MKRLLLLPLLGVALLLGACAGFGQKTGAPSAELKTVLGKAYPTIKAVQNGVAQACQFLPYADSIAKLFNKKSPDLVSTNDYVKAICDAVTTLPLADGPGRRVARVNGVVIRGRRL